MRFGRHGVGGGAGDLTMQAVAPSLLASGGGAGGGSSSQGSIAHGTYVVQTPSGGGTEAYRAPSTNATSTAHLADGTSVYCNGVTSNQFALAQYSTPTGYASGWVPIPMLVLQPLPSATPATPAGGPNAGANAGANTPPVRDYPGAPPAVNQSVPGAQQPGTPTASKIPWLPLGVAAALGWFFLVEQKKKGRKRK